MKSIATWKLISSSLDKGIAVMLLYVLESSGSSPGRQGFFMAVNDAGDMEGSIGGGIMEHKLVEMAKEKLRAASYEPACRKRQVARPIVQLLITVSKLVTLNSKPHSILILCTLHTPAFHNIGNSRFLSVFRKVWNV